MLINRFLINLQETKNGGQADDFSEFAADMSLVFVRNTTLPQTSQAGTDEAAPTFPLSPFTRTRTVSQIGPDTTSVAAELPAEGDPENSASLSLVDPVGHAEEIQNVRITFPLPNSPLTCFSYKYRRLRTMPSRGFRDVRRVRTR